MEQDGIEGPALLAGEAWFEPIEAGIRGRLRGLIEALVDQELATALGRALRTGRRHGHRRRRLHAQVSPVWLARCQAQIRATAALLEAERKAAGEGGIGSPGASAMPTSRWPARCALSGRRIRACSRRAIFRRSPRMRSGLRRCRRSGRCRSPSSRQSDVRG